MSRKSRAGLGAVEKLIEQRRLFQDWLARLDSGVEAMPPHVVERVRNDYRTRLASVMAELSGHQDALRQSRADARARHKALTEQQQARKDELAELRLRKHVGEMDDEKFRAQAAELKQQLDAVARELAACQRDIERGEEILDAIAAASEVLEYQAPVSRAGTAEETEERPEEKGRGMPEERAGKTEEMAGSRDEPEPERAAAAAPQDAGVDELEFLRSVTTAVAAKGAAAPRPKDKGEVRSGESQVSRRAPSQAGAAAVEAPPASTPSEPEPSRQRAEERPQLDAAPGLLHLKLDEAEPAQPAERAAAPAVLEKTHKCGECGTLNLPTEWYCEKCGAELTPV